MSFAALESLTANWPMAFSSVHFLFFLPLAAGVYFLLPKGKIRQLWLLLASYYFYFFAAPKHLIVLLGGTLASWLLGLFAAAGKAPKNRTRRMVFGVALLVFGLCFFKYNGFFADILSPAFKALNPALDVEAFKKGLSGYFTTGEALGISFYTFTAIGYLVDVSRGDVPPEKNLLDYALFIGFFATVTMGPIARAGSLLPQLRDNTRRFDADTAAKGLVRMACGFFKKLAVADTLTVFTGAVYGNLAAYSGGTLTLAALAFMLQLYFDFSGYSDIVIGAAQIFGIRLPENFKNPYFATNFSGLWSRWHISLSSFLQDYIFTPLVWSRWTEKLPAVGKKVKNPPVLSSLFIVFMVSGVWHGDTLCYLVWGALQAAFRIGEELLHRAVGKPKKKPSLPVRIGKTAVVLVLWMESLVFFRVGLEKDGGVMAAAAALVRQFRFVSPATVWGDLVAAMQTGFFPSPLIALLFIAFTLGCLALAFWADWVQCFRLKGGDLAAGIMGLRAAPRWAVYLLLTLGCFAGFIAISGGFDGTSFLYAGY
ncbi:hypothetical protein LJC60_03630 [Ruminococcaceae bacterium OttesenSCG-928-D13]|nr:hypothetical protein [Ruminococcaceae bacterium OttesenSCG-928-D13]